MNQENKLYRISQLLSRFKEQVTILNSNGEFSINIHAENILIKVLNEIYSCNLQNVNYEEGKTYPSIDLRDKSKRIAIQVTSTSDLKKIKHTLSKFIENKLHKEYDKLYIFIITQKQSKYDQLKIDIVQNGVFKFKVSDIIDRTDIYTELNSQNDLDKINKICVLLEKQFSDNIPELKKWDLYCKGLQEYDKYIENLYTFLDIKGFSPKVNNTLVKINLKNIYVPLKLKLESEFDVIEKKSSKIENEIIYSIEDALKTFDNLVVLGDPGSGKSTVLKHLAYNICTNRTFSNQFEDYVPVIIKGSEFADYVSSTSKNLSEFIIDHFDKKYELLFTQKLENNKLLVLIDGIDEINQISLRHKVVNKLNAFIAQFPKIKIIVSSRIVGYKETRLNGFFNHLQVAPFKKEQIQKFVKNWYLSISSSSDEDTNSALIKADQLYNSIKENQSVLKMASNPLLITIIALIYYKGNALPEKRASLYDIATSTFLENWVYQRDSKKSSNFDKDLLIEILAPISFHIHQNYTTGLISESELKLKLTEEYKNINPYLSSKETRQDVKDIINFLREDAGFLFEKGLDDNGESLFGFIHQTFQEYFTAIEFKTRWKEDFFNKNLDKYVFDSNWIEVIKLTASIFKLNDPSRLGRQSTSTFINDILNVKDSYPEIYRPLKVVVQILKDNTEIEFNIFTQIIDIIFKDILILSEYEGTDHYSSNREVWTFSYFIGELMDTKIYQSYIIERTIKELTTNDDTTPLQENLIGILIRVSYNTQVKKELIKILNSDNNKLKQLIFNHNRISTLFKIIKTKEFHSEIVEYVNSNDFIRNYEGHLPTQYYFSFETNLKDYLEEHPGKTDSVSINKFYESQILLSIRLIKNDKIRKDYINYIVFSIGMSGLKRLQEFYNIIKKEYPKISLPKITREIEELKIFESYKLNEYEVIEFKSVKLFLKRDEPSNVAFIKNKSVQFFKFPFNSIDLEPYFKKDTKSFLKFLSQVIPILGESNKKLTISTISDLLNYIKYSNTIHWNTDIKTSSNLNFALSNIIRDKQVDNSIYNWIKNTNEFSYIKFEPNDSFNRDEFKINILASNLEIHDKLYLLNFVGEKPYYEDLIQPTIESLKTEKSSEKRNEIKNILYQVL